MRDGCPGVRYQDSENVAGWTQVVGRYGGKRKDSLILYCVGFLQTTLCKRFTKTVAVNLTSLVLKMIEELTIPTGANVRFDIYEKTPGLQI